MSRGSGGYGSEPTSADGYSSSEEGGDSGGESAAQLAGCRGRLGSGVWFALSVWLMWRLVLFSANCLPCCCPGAGDASVS